MWSERMELALAKMYSQQRNHFDFEPRYLSFTYQETQVHLIYCQYVDLFIFPLDQPNRLRLCCLNQIVEKLFGSSVNDDDLHLRDYYIEKGVRYDDDSQIEQSSIDQIVENLRKTNFHQAKLGDLIVVETNGEFKEVTRFGQLCHNTERIFKRGYCTDFVQVLVKRFGYKPRQFCYVYNDEGGFITRLKINEEAQNKRCVLDDHDFCLTTIDGQEKAVDITGLHNLNDFISQMITTEDGSQFQYEISDEWSDDCDNILGSIYERQVKEGNHYQTIRQRYTESIVEAFAAKYGLNH